MLLCTGKQAKCERSPYVVALFSSLIWKELLLQLHKRFYNLQNYVARMFACFHLFWFRPQQSTEIEHASRFCTCEVLLSCHVDCQSGSHQLNAWDIRMPPVPSAYLLVHTSNEHYQHCNSCDSSFCWGMGSC